MTPEHVIFTSLGNDSIALTQWAFERKLSGLIVAHSDTGWASEEWGPRREKARTWIESHGIPFVVIQSIGLEALVRQRKGWPLPRKYQFCTTELKIRPAQEWLARVDPHLLATCLVGVRREESAERRDWPEWLEASDKHGWRSLWSPLVTFTEQARNELLARAGWEPLPHRSRECFPCINSMRATLRELPESKIDQIETIEGEMGITRNGKPRTMFRPYRHMGAIGIREVVRWANSERGEYEPPEQTGCDSGMCGE